MTARTYGALTLDVPAELEDDTMVVLRGRQPAPAVAMRMTTKQAIRPSFIVKRVQLGANPPPLSAIAEVEEKTLHSAVQGLKVHEKKEEQGALVLEASFDSPEGRVRQVQITRVIGSVACCFVGTALDDTSFPDVKKQLLALAASAALA